MYSFIYLDGRESYSGTGAMSLIQIHKEKLSKNLKEWSNLVKKNVKKLSELSIAKSSA